MEYDREICELDVVSFGVTWPRVKLVQLCRHFRRLDKAREKWKSRILNLDVCLKWKSKSDHEESEDVDVDEDDGRRGRLGLLDDKRTAE